MAKGNNVVEFTLRAKDHVSRVLHSIGGSIASFTKGLLNQGANIKAWGDMIAGAFQSTFGRLWGSIREAFKFETLEGQFRTLLGSVDAAKERMQMLARVAEETPFDMEGVVKASRILTVMSKDALGTEWALKLVGDTAAAVGANVDELAMWIGRAYAMIQSGKPFGEAAMRLTELGALTPEVRQKMEDLQASGAANSEVWEALVTHLETFGGAMKDLSQTGDGLVSTLEDNWTAAVREFGSAFMASAKDSIGFLINKLKELQASGAITEWAEKAMKALEPLRNLIVGILGDDNSRAQAFSAAWDYLKAVFTYGAEAIKATADYFFDKITSAYNQAIDVIAEPIAKFFEEIRYHFGEFGDLFKFIFDRDNWDPKGKLERSRDHAAREQAIEYERARRATAASDSFAQSLEAAGAKLSKATDNLTTSLREAAEKGAKAVEEGAKAAEVAAKESAEEQKERLAAEKDKASIAMGIETQDFKDAQFLEELVKEEEKERKNHLKKLTEARSKSNIDERVRAAVKDRDEKYKRATDSDYAKEQEKKEKEEQKTRDKYNKRARNLLQREGRKILDSNFDLSKLSKRDRRLAEAMRAEKNVEKLEKLRENAYNANVETAKNTKATLEITKQLLALK